MTQVNRALLELFQSHHIDAVLADEWVTFPGRHLRARSAIIEQPEPRGIAIQYDVHLEIGAGLTIIESFAGLGDTREQCVADAFHNFAVSSFHVLLAAFFRSDNQQATQEEWVIGGRKGRVVIGNIGVRGKPPVEGEPLVSWFKRFEEKLKERNLRPGTHWVRLYYAHLQGKTLACEVLLDNRECAEVQAEMAAIDWPSSDDFYSARVFVVMHITPGRAVTADDAVAWLAEALAPRHQLTEDDAYVAMADAGIPDALAGRAFSFTQIAWGRAFLADLGVPFPGDYCVSTPRARSLSPDNWPTSPSSLPLPNWSRSTPRRRGLLNLHCCRRMSMS